MNPLKKSTFLVYQDQSGLILNVCPPPSPTQINTNYQAMIVIKGEEMVQFPKLSELLSDIEYVWDIQGTHIQSNSLPVTLNF